MLEFHEEGIGVKFYSEDNEFRVADVYLVKVPDNYSFEENINILNRITNAMLCTEYEESVNPVNLREAANNFVQTMNRLHEDSTTNKNIIDVQDNKPSITVARQERVLKLNIL